MNSCFYAIKTFLKKYQQSSKPILFGFSGGSDSLALLFSLMKARQCIPIDVHVAHIDHGWRKESTEQAQHLQKMVEDLGLPFYLHQAVFSGQSSNLEEMAREERLDFFKKIYEQIDAEALILAHQAQDLAETVLKRIGEGADLFSLHGMEEIATLQEMQIWRPFLKVSKKEIVHWLEKNDLHPIDDETNRDCRFLRARMREKIFPFFNQEFGKETASNFVRLSDSVTELKEYFIRKTEKYFLQEGKDRFGIFYDLHPLFPLDRVECRFFLKQLAKRENLFFSYDQQELAIEHILANSIRKIIVDKNRKVIVDRGKILIGDY